VKQQVKHNSGLPEPDLLQHPSVALAPTGGGMRQATSSTADTRPANLLLGVQSGPAQAPGVGLGRRSNAWAGDAPQADSRTGRSSSVSGVGKLRASSMASA
jgi:hypothetical protein